MTSVHLANEPDCRLSLKTSITDPSITGQSITLPSIFSFTASIQSEGNTTFVDTLPEQKNWQNELAPGHPCKRKREKKVSTQTSKRRRVIGRPKNRWMPTRVRKLIRLYLMTELDIVDIAKVLQTKDFRPCKRDVQAQLKNLLQPRPDQIRRKGKFTATRLLQLHRCKKSQKSQRIWKPACLGKQALPPPNNLYAAIDEGTFGDKSPATDTAKNGWLWFESCKVQGARQTDGYESTRLCVSGIEENDTGSCNTVNTSENRMSRQTSWNIVDASLSGLMFKPQQPDFGSQALSDQNKKLDTSLMILGTSREAQILEDSLSRRCLLSELTGSVLMDSRNSITTHDCQFPNPRARPVVNAHFVLEDEASDKELEAQSTFSIDENSCQSSVLDRKGLRQRLSFAHSHGRIKDVLSVLEYLTLSGTSEPSSGKPRPRSGQVSASSSSGKLSSGHNLSFADGLPTSSSLKPSNILSKAKPGYCWESIISLCVSTDQSLFPKRQMGRANVSINSASVRVNVLSSIVYEKIKTKRVNDKDAFGNSILHIAVSALVNPEDISTLINLGADVRSQNNAGQTFLHLMSEENLHTYDICYLLYAAKDHGFDFTQQDHLGQSVLHLLTRPCIPQNILDAIITTLYDLGVDTNPSKDYLGHTVVEQLNDFRDKFDAACQVGLLGLTSENTGLRLIERKTLKKDKGRPDTSSICHEISSEKFRRNADIKTLADLNYYTHHADLLRVIIRAVSMPWVEDSEGRNGLHCLAEVSLKQPSHLKIPPKDTASRKFPARECYLIDLLDVGVDPNHYDKQGQTPLMAFITHSRADEVEDLTTRLLARLVKAKANIHWRNRKGETALHLAVKLGRRAATKYLLQEQANVHARTACGQGILALGLEHCRRARSDQTLYAQIMLCISLAIDAGAVSAPTILQEWAFPAKPKTGVA